MDGDTEDLVVQLCTRIGMVMEDASEAAFTISGLDPVAHGAAIDQLHTAAVKIRVLVQAAKALLL